jgi:light-regulated signal transduction histidine kinase (bacteriophytochrome)/ActR/RegA family two-component response regulator
MLSAPASLATCDDEPIHQLGAIQPIGFLLSVDADWMVVRASANAQAYLGTRAGDVIGRQADALIPADLLHDIRGRLQRACELEVAEPLFRRLLAPNGPLFSVAMHRSGDEIVLEFEETGGEPPPSPAVLRGMMDKIARHRDMDAVFREAARQVRALTGFDRVMVYRFDDAGNGEVVGEAVRSGAASYKGLHYPATDIPKQARALYLRNLSRIIVDIEHLAVPVTPARSTDGGLLDLTHSVLRSVSPVHIEYLRNMGVRASMSISLVRNGELWGLIACHHGQPKHLELETRLIAELFGRMFSYLLEVREQEADAAYDERVLAIHNRVAAAFVDPETALTCAPHFLTGLADYVDCDGIGIIHAGEVNLVGLTPTPEEFVQLLKFLNRTKSSCVFATNDLAEVYPPAADFAMRAAGLMSIPISRSPRDYLVFFRRDAERTIAWAGRPEKDVDASGPNGVRLTPRKSFAAWRETVRGKSEPWRKRELRAAETLRLTLVEAVLRLSDRVGEERLAAQHRQEILIAELNHRVRNLLGLVHGLIGQAAALATDIPSLVEGLEQRVLSLARAYDLLIMGSWQSGSLHSLLHAEIEAFDLADGLRLELAGPDVRLEPKAFSAVAMVVHELVTNARKYGALKLPTGRIMVKTGHDALDNVTVAWRETGGPVVAVPTRRGFGSMLVERIIPFEVHGVSTPRYPPTGFQLDLVLPAAAATLQAPEPRRTEAASRAADAAPALRTPLHEDQLADLLQTCLLVEDNLFISADAEDLLQAMGAKTVAVAKSVAEAMDMFDDYRFTFAVLDVNLGRETSLPIAQALLDAHVKFVFATGYGEALAIPDAMAGVPIVAKPYHRAKLEKALMGLLQGATDAPAQPVAG